MEFLSQTRKGGKVHIEKEKYDVNFEILLYEPKSRLQLEGGKNAISFATENSVFFEDSASAERSDFIFNVSHHAGSVNECNFRSFPDF
jgi:hypothetical protein